MTHDPAPQKPNTMTALGRDVAAMMGRRQALALIGGGAALAACCTQDETMANDGRPFGPPPGPGGPGGPGGPPPSEPHETIVSEYGCASYSNETNGPYPADGSNRANGAVANVLIDSGIVRKDIRPSFNGLTAGVNGVQLDLTIKLVNVNAKCQPVTGHALYLWHCDTHGKYSIYDEPDANWLRGVGVSDDKGEIEFTTIFPGCYPGRYTHFHFEVYETLAKATHYNNRLLVSQMATPFDLTEAFYKEIGDQYGNSLRNLRNNPIATDNVFGDNNPEEIEAQTLAITGNAKTGFKATVTVGMLL